MSHALLTMSSLIFHVEQDFMKEYRYKSKDERVKSKDAVRGVAPDGNLYSFLKCEDLYSEW